MPKPAAPLRELQVLEQIEADPNATQASLANQLGVAVGTVNFVVKRLIKKGYVRVTQLQRRRLKYIVTPEGLALRTKLAMDSLQYSMRLYRETRAAACRLVAQAQRSGHAAVRIEGGGDLADIVRLTCLDEGLAVVPDGATAVIKIEGTRLNLEG